MATGSNDHRDRVYHADNQRRSQSVFAVSRDPVSCHNWICFAVERINGMKITRSNEPAPKTNWKIVVQYKNGFKGGLLARFTTKAKADAYAKKLFDTDTVQWYSVEDSDWQEKTA